MLIVWQAKDGTLYVGDGHQRSGLARRLIGEGRYDDIPLTAKLYREADGFTPDMVMARAAGANILNGSGTPADAAKIIRRFGLQSDFLKGFDGTSAFGRAARGLSQLSDDAFGMVINGDPETAVIGAIVGNAAPDAPEMHAGLIAAMRVADVANAREMELMVRDMLAAPRVTEHQEDMFGMLAVTRGLYAERAKILDRALSDIRREKRVLATAAENSEVLEAAWSRVDKARAARIAEENAVLAEVVARLARVTDNPVNAALSRAAERMVKERGNPGNAAKGFIEELRGDPALQREIVGGRSGPGDRGGDAGRTGGLEDDFGAEARKGDPQRLEEARREARVLVEQFPAREAGGRPGTHNIGSRAPAGDGSGRTRGALRDAIFDKLLARPARQGREAHIIMGPPAAGKSSLAEPLAKARGARIIDSDDAKALLPEYRDGVGASAVHLESAEIAKAVEKKSIAAGDNIILPVVGKTLDKLEKRISDLAAQGYKVYLHLVDLPSDKAVERAVRRFHETGRLVDPDYVASVGNAPRENFEQLVATHGAELEGWLNVSNDVPQGEAAKLIRASDEELYRSLGDRRRGVGERRADSSGESTPDTEGMDASDVSRVGGDSGRQREALPDLEDAETNALTARARMGEAVAAFDDPDGAGAAAQAGHLLHDMEADVKAAGAAAPEEEGGLFALFGEEEGTARAQLEALEQETADFARVKGCLGGQMEGGQ